MAERQPTKVGPEQIPTALQHSLNKILDAIAESKNTLQKQIGSVAVELELLRADHNKLSERVKTTETTLETLQPEQQRTQQQLTGLKERVLTQENRAEDAEG